MPPSPAESEAGAVSSGLHPLLQRLFADWERHRLNWCVLRMPENTLAPDSDIDLLIDPSDLDAVAGLAESHGFIRAPGKRLGLHLVTYDSHTGTWLWLHCVSELGFGPFQSLRADAASRLLGGRRPGFPPRLSLNDEFWVTLAHCLLDRRKVAIKHRQRLTILAADSTPDGAIAQGFNRLLPPGLTSKHLLKAAQRQDWDTLEHLVPRLMESAVRRARPSLVRRGLQLGVSLLSRVSDTRRRRGVSVALLGPDGAGKSTLATGLERTFVFPVRQVYMGLTGGMLWYVDRLRVPGVVRVGRLAVIWCRYLTAQYHLIRGRLVVFDRYIYDAEVPTPHPLSLAGRLGRWIDGRSCPSPDLVLLLDAPGQIMHQRKPSYTPETIENWRQHFLRLRHRLSNTEVIDTTCGVEEVRKQATELVWRHYTRRWRRVHDLGDRDG